MKSNTIITDAISLFAITLISGLLLGSVYEVTKEPIEKQQLIAKQEAYKKVFSEAKTFEEDEVISEMVTTSEETLAKEGYTGIKIDEVLEALDGSGELLGYVMTVTTKNGYGTAMTITVGKTLDNTVQGVEFLTISETAGLGMKAKDAAFKDQYKGKSEEKFSVTKTGKTKDSEIDAISGATITSDAVTGAVNASSYFMNNCILKGQEDPS